MTRRGSFARREVGIGLVKAILQDMTRPRSLRSLIHAKISRHPSRSRHPTARVRGSKRGYTGSGRQIIICSVDSGQTYHLLCPMAHLTKKESLSLNPRDESVAKDDEGPSGFLWKRAPRTTDTDKSSLRRVIAGFKQGNKYQQRWFQLAEKENELRYFRQRPLNTSTESYVEAKLGAIDLQSILEIRKNDPPPDERTPTEHIFSVECAERVYELCAQTVEERTQWVECLSQIVAKRKEREARTPRARQAASFASTNEPSPQGARTRGRSTAFALEQTGNVEEQAVLFNAAKEEDATAHWSGNLGLQTLSLYSASPLTSRWFFLTILNGCSNASSQPEALLREFSNCSYLFLPEGEKLNQTLETITSVYFVLEGELMACLPIGGEDTYISAVEAGDWIGPCELQVSDRWMQEFTCASRTILIEMSVEHFKELLEGPHYPRLKESIADKCRQNYKDVLCAIPLFESPDDGCRDAAGLFECRYFAPGSKLVLEGGEADSFYVIVSGAASVTKGKENLLVHTACAGDYFGEMGLLKNQPRAASVSSILEGVFVLMTNREAFSDLLGTYPIVNSRIHHHLGHQMHRILTKVPLFSKVRSYYDNIGDVCTFVQFGPGKTIVKQGGDFDGFYCIIAG